MESQCGQCKKPFSSLCQQKFECPLHQAQCFACQPCRQSKESQEQEQIGEQCDICSRICQIHELFFDYQCEKYICRFHFLILDVTQEYTQLPCGDSQLTEEIIIFMCSYCILCGRKLSKVSKDQLGVCLICERAGFTSAYYAEKSVQQQLLIKQDLTKNIEKKQQKKQAQYQNKLRQLTKQIQQLKNELLLQSQTLKISQFTRSQIKSAIHHSQRDKECLICLESFNSALKKPVMVCLQQHLICQKCIQEQLTLKNCPLCRDQINKAKIYVSRQRMKTMQLQQIISEKYEIKMQKCLEIQRKGIPQQVENSSTSIQPNLDGQAQQQNPIQQKFEKNTCLDQKNQKKIAETKQKKSVAGVKLALNDCSSGRKRGRPINLANSSRKKQKL